MLSMQEMSDRLEIQDLFVSYSHAIDQRDWDALDQVFTSDAFIDYTATGSVRGSLPEIKPFLDQSLAQFSSFQHLVGTSKIVVKGDAAESRTILFNPLVLEHEGAPHVFFCGCWYRDKLVRTTEGWRIKERVQEPSYYHNVPAWFKPDF